MKKTYEIRPLHDSESATWTYLLIDKATRKAAIIDSVAENIERDLRLIAEMKLAITYIMETHIHADHVTAAAQIKSKTGAPIVLGAGAKSATDKADIYLDDGVGIMLGETAIKALSTPGHTDSCTSYLVNGAVFTGDALLIRGCGRTDFQQGDAGRLYDSVHKQLYSLPDDTRIYPGHDYKGMLLSTIGEEKVYNPRLRLENSRDDFIRIMKELKLDPPKKIDIAVPENIELGANYKAS